MQGSLKYLGGAAGVAAALAFWIGTQQPSPGEPVSGSAKPVAEKSAAPPAARVVDTIPSGAAQRVAPQPPGAAEMMRNSRDYRVVHEALARAGTREARFYAKEILRYCRVLRQLGLREDVPASHRQMAASELVQARCSSFSNGELSTQALQQIDTDARYPPGLEELSREWGDAGSSEERQKALFAKVLETNDPLLLQRVGLSYLGQDSGTVELGGLTFTDGPTRDAMHMAWTAAVCEGTGTECGAGEHYMVDICANADVCEDSRSSAMRALVARAHGEIYLATYDAAYAMFVKAIQARNVAFFFTQGPP